MNLKLIVEQKLNKYKLQPGLNGFYKPLEVCV